MGEPNPGPPKGVVVFYENVKVAITDGKVTVSVATRDGQKVVRVSQRDGSVE